MKIKSQSPKVTDCMIPFMSNSSNDEIVKREAQISTVRSKGRRGGRREVVTAIKRVPRGTSVVLYLMCQSMSVPWL